MLRVPQKQRIILAFLVNTNRRIFNQPWVECVCVDIFTIIVILWELKRLAKIAHYRIIEKFITSSISGTEKVTGPFSLPLY
jgi:hypothetical protein